MTSVRSLPPIFRLCADSETNVQNAVQFLDNAVKDIVTSNTEVWMRLGVDGA